MLDFVWAGTDTFSRNIFRFYREHFDRSANVFIDVNCYRCSTFVFCIHAKMHQEYCINWHNLQLPILRSTTLFVDCIKFKQKEKFYFIQYGKSLKPFYTKITSFYVARKVFTVQWFSTLPLKLHELWYLVWKSMFFNINIQMSTTTTTKMQVLLFYWHFIFFDGFD